MYKLLISFLVIVFLSAGSISAFQAPESWIEYLHHNEELQFDHSARLVAACTLKLHNANDSLLGYSSGYAQGDRTVVLVDPSECGDPTYPFEVSSFSFTLVAFSGWHWPLELDVVVYEPHLEQPGCWSPGAELYRFAITCTAEDFLFPDVGVAEFPTTFCAEGPFFIGVDYTDPSAGTLPSVAFDVESDPTLCDVFMLYDTTWYEWHAFWVVQPGYPLYWVNGETVSINCCDDGDADGICDILDNCPTVANNDQADADEDGVGDLCDICPGYDDNVDTDADGWPDGCDACPDDFNPGQEDGDGDAIADACDNCPDDQNAGQEDADGDGLGDICDACPNDPYNDVDGDGYCGDVDNCPGIYNPSQADGDGNGIGDACENCCLGNAGNVNYDGGDTIDVSDLTFLVAYLFQGGQPPPCLEEADLDGSLGVDVADLTYLVDYLFVGGPVPVPCP